MKQNKFLSMFSCGSIPTRDNKDCIEFETNRFIHVAFVLKSNPIVVNQSFVDNLILACIADTAYIIPNISGTMSEASYTEGKGYGKQTSQVQSAKHTAIIADPQIMDNVQYWNDLRKRTLLYDMYLFTTSYVWAIEESLTIMPKIPVTDALETFITSNVTVNWSNIDLPVPYKLSESEINQLEETIELFALPSPIWVSTGEGTYTSGNNTIAIDISNVGNTVFGNTVLTLTAGVNIYNVEVYSGTLPTGLSVTLPTATTIQIEGDVTAGTSGEAIIKATNQTGVSQYVPINFVLTA